MIDTDKNLLAELRKDMAELEIAIDGLKMSFDKCSHIGIRNYYNFEEQESFDSLTSKFGRTSDIYTQRILKTILLLLRENPKSFIDRANLAEKLEIISSADDLLVVRDLRNEIVHEYVSAELSRIYREVLNQYSNLIDAIVMTKKFIEQRGWR
jgi:hypothetical protein